LNQWKSLSQSLSNIRFDFADSQNRSTFQKPIATYRLSPDRADLVNQVKAQRADGKTSAFSTNVDKVKIGRSFR
jgi:hypothetical protein